MLEEFGRYTKIVICFFCIQVFQLFFNFIWLEVKIIPNKNLELVFVFAIIFPKFIYKFFCCSHKITIKLICKYFSIIDCNTIFTKIYMVIIFLPIVQNFIILLQNFLEYFMLSWKQFLKQFFFSFCLSLLLYNF